MNFIKVNMPSTPLRCLTPCDTSVSTLNDRLFSNKRANAQCPFFVDCIYLLNFLLYFLRFHHFLISICCVFCVFLRLTLQFLSNTFSNTLSKNVKT